MFETCDNDMTSIELIFIVLCTSGMYGCGHCLLDCKTINNSDIKEAISMPLNKNTLNVHECV